MSATAAPARQTQVSSLAVANVALQYLARCQHVKEACGPETCYCGLVDTCRALARYRDNAQAMRDVRRGE